MFEEFPRVRHEVESISKNYKQFFTAEAIETKTDHERDTRITLAITPLVEPERFVKNLVEYITVLESKKLIESQNGSFLLIPKMKVLECKKAEIVFNGDTINPATISVIYDKKDTADEKNKERSWGVMYGLGNASVWHPLTPETLIKFLEFLKDE